jgi:hypothetical protein
VTGKAAPGPFFEWQRTAAARGKWGGFVLQQAGAAPRRGGPQVTHRSILRVTQAMPVLTSSIIWRRKDRILQNVAGLYGVERVAMRWCRVQKTGRGAAGDFGGGDAAASSALT